MLSPRFRSRRSRGPSHALALACRALLIVSAAGAAEAQSFTTRESSNVAAVRSGEATERHRLTAGERSVYDLRLGGHAVGTGSLEVLGEERIDGHVTLHVALQVSGGVLLARVNDRFDSWIDPDELFSRRYVQDQHELTQHRHREYLLSPERRSYSEAGERAESPMGTRQPLDDVSFLFYARSLPLKVGDVDSIPRYFKPGHDVILRVLRRQRVTVPAGTFETVVVQPTITNAGGLFGQGGEAEVYFTDDAARTIVQIRSKVPVVGSLSLHLREFRASR